MEAEPAEVDVGVADGGGPLAEDGPAPTDATTEPTDPTEPLGSCSRAVAMAGKRSALTSPPPLLLLLLLPLPVYLYLLKPAALSESPRTDGLGGGLGGGGEDFSEVDQTEATAGADAVAVALVGNLGGTEKATAAAAVVETP